jgi:hypothetical protein
MFKRVLAILVATVANWRSQGIPCPRQGENSSFLIEERQSQSLL